MQQPAIEPFLLSPWLPPRAGKHCQRFWVKSALIRALHLRYARRVELDWTRVTGAPQTMNIDTTVVQRLRDALVASGQFAAPGPVEGAAAQGGSDQFLLERFYPFAETLYFMMMVDDLADPLELDAIRGAMRILSNGALGDNLLDDIFSRCRQRAQERGVEACLQEIGATLASDRLDRETAFTLAAAVALADHELLDAETALMLSIAEWFGISGKRAMALLDAL